jgi:hypothetical protein
VNPSPGQAPFVPKPALRLPDKEETQLPRIERRRINQFAILRESLTLADQPRRHQQHSDLCAPPVQRTRQVGPSPSTRSTTTGPLPPAYYSHFLQSKRSRGHGTAADIAVAAAARSSRTDAPQPSISVRQPTQSARRATRA